METAHDSFLYLHPLKQAQVLSVTSRVQQQHKFRTPSNYEKLLSLSEGTKLVGPTMLAPSRKENQTPRKAVKDKKQSTIRSSEQSLPERLAYVLRALKPGVLSHSPSSSSHFRKNQAQKCKLADDVVYISTAEHMAGKRPGNQKKSKSLFTKYSPSQHNLTSDALMDEGGPFQKVSNLDQLRQMYKSVPNVSHSMEDETQKFENGFDCSYSCETALSGAYSQISSKSAESSAFSAKSPTDSGYRSANRNMDSFLDEDSLQPCLMTASYHSGANDSFVPNKATVVMINDSDNSPVINTRPIHYEDRIVPLAPSPKPEINWLPFSERDFVILLQKGRCKDVSNLVGVSLLAEIIRITKVTLDGLATEISRLSNSLVKTTPEIVKRVTSILLPEKVALSCQKSGTKACSMYTLSASDALKVSMSQRSGLYLNVGNFYRFLVEVRVSYAVTDHAAVMLCGILECFVEELIKTAVWYSGKKALPLDVFDKINTLDELFAFLDRANNYESTPESTTRKYEVEAVPKIKSAETACCTKTMTEFISLVESARPRELCPALQSKQFSRLSYSGHALKSLFYFVKCRRSNCQCTTTTYFARRTIAEWLRISAIFAYCRLDNVVKEQDVLQTARVILRIDTPPPSLDINFTHSSGLSKAQLGLSLLTKGYSAGIDLVGNLWHSFTDKNGFSPISLAIINGDDDAASELLSIGAKASIPMPRDVTEFCPFVDTEFAGWIPLTWAVAHGSVRLFNELIEACSDIDENYMIKESPLQLAVIVGDNDMANRLLVCGGCPFRSCANYDSTKGNYRLSGSPSALALAAARGNWPLMEVMFSQGSPRRHEKEETMTVLDFLKDESPSKPAFSQTEDAKTRPQPHSFVDSLSKIGQRAALEAFYYSVETGHIDVALKLRKMGVQWNIHTWIRSLQYAFTERSRPQMHLILSEFTSSLMEDLNVDNIEDVISVLFYVLHSEANLSDGNLNTVSAKISKIYNRYKRQRTDVSRQTAEVSNAVRSIIDPKYVDNPELSDIRFRTGSNIIYAHRIVLVNASEEFRDLLENPNGLIDVHNVDYAVFKLIMQYLYGNTKIFFNELSQYSFQRQFEVYDTSARFGLNGVIEECRQLIKSNIDCSTCVQVYKIAKKLGIAPLLSDCEDFFMENLPQLVVQDQVRALLAGTLDQIGQTDLCANLAKKVIDSFALLPHSAQ